MPFLKDLKNKYIPKVKEWDQKSNKNGLEPAIFNAYKDQYIGEWKNNRKHGKGQRICKNKTILYEGDFNEDYREGYGTQCVRACDGVGWVLEYRGMWYKGFRHGKGARLYKDGRYYEGEFVYNKRVGVGHMWWPDGTYYCGEWLDGVFHGLGIFVYANCNRYEGHFWCGLKHGEGVFYHVVQGQEQKGIWIRGVPRCVYIADLQYRQSAKEPSKYPIPKVGLFNPDSVLNRTMNYLRRLYLINGPENLNISPSQATSTWSVAGDAEVICPARLDTGTDSPSFAASMADGAGAGDAEEDTKCSCAADSKATPATGDANRTAADSQTPHRVFETESMYRKFNGCRNKCIRFKD